jgi:hypothetical protein
MGTFAEKVIVDDRLSFSDQGKQTSIFRFRFPLTASKVFLFALVPFSHIYIYDAHTKRLFGTFCAVGRLVRGTF